MWNCGAILGPVIGGLLAEPETGFPNTLGKIALLREYPYLLPCLVSASIAFLSFVFVSVGLKETLASKKPQNESTETLLGNDSSIPNYGSTPETHSSKPPTLKELLTPRLSITFISYAFVAFTDMSYEVLVPLMYSTSIPSGGLGFHPHQIGIIMGSVGIAGAFLQVTVFTKMIKRYGPKRVLTMSLCGILLATECFPVLSFLAKRRGRVDGLVGAVLAVQVLSGLTMSPAYTSMQVLVVDSSPSKAALASTNSVAQMTACGIRFLAPSVASSLFALSAELNLLGGYFVYMILLGVGLCAIRVSFMLPRRMQALK